MATTCYDRAGLTPVSPVNEYTRWGVTQHLSYKIDSNKEPAI